MTVCVSVKVSEGLVLAADSTAAIQGTMQDPAGNTTSGILKTYDHARKLSHIKDYPIGTLTWGSALVGARSIESLIKEFEQKIPALSTLQEELRESRLADPSRPVQHPQYCVRDIAQNLLKHLRDFYDSEFAGANGPKQPQVCILVSGYSSAQFFPEQWLIQMPGNQDLEQIRPNDKSGKPTFGANWYGLTDAIVRLHHGRDDQVVQEIAKRFSVSPDEAKKVLGQFEYPVYFDGMPLQDAIDYAVYLVNVVIGRYRFVAGAPLCGGEVDVAAIMPDTFTWISRKSWHASSRPLC
jgi:hypothetical protein